MDYLILDTVWLMMGLDNSLIKGGIVDYFVMLNGLKTTKSITG
jgi:hypothetical protein